MRAILMLSTIAAMLLQPVSFASGHGAHDGHRCGVDCACPIDARPEATGAAHGGSAHGMHHGSAHHPHGGAADASAHHAGVAPAPEAPLCSMRASCGSDGHPVHGAARGGSAARPAVLAELDRAQSLVPLARVAISDPDSPSARSSSPPTPPPRSVSS